MSMDSPTPRRSLLRGLATLPLIGGGVAVLGKPTAAAVPPSDALLDSYAEWLFMERRILCEERGLDDRTVTVNTGASDYHLPHYPLSWRDLPQPSTRAAIVLATVGCDWHGGLKR